MATLTGMQPIATGRYHAAILSSSEQLENECVIAGKMSGELGLNFLVIRKSLGCFWLKFLF